MTEPNIWKLYLDVQPFTPTQGEPEPELKRLHLNDRISLKLVNGMYAEYVFSELITGVFKGMLAIVEAENRVYPTTFAIRVHQKTNSVTHIPVPNSTVVELTAGESFLLEDVHSDSLWHCTYSHPVPVQEGINCDSFNLTIRVHERQSISGLSLPKVKPVQDSKAAEDIFPAKPQYELPQVREVEPLSFLVTVTKTADSHYLYYLKHNRQVGDWFVAPWNSAPSSPGKKTPFVPVTSLTDSKLLRAASDTGRTVSFLQLSGEPLTGTELAQYLPERFLNKSNVGRKQYRILSGEHSGDVVGEDRVSILGQHPESPALLIAKDKQVRTKAGELTPTIIVEQQEMSVTMFEPDRHGDFDAKVEALLMPEPDFDSEDDWEDEDD